MSQINAKQKLDGFAHLQAHVATSAFDSDQKFDAPACHPNTRIAVLDEIMNWVLGIVTRVQWILWLNGAAGAGKSAIARSIVEHCLKRKIPIARFFFYRTDPTRNNINPVVPTLVHQLIRTIPELEELIIPKVGADPLIFTKSLETQFTYLIFEPLRRLGQQLRQVPTVFLLFDGVDECIDKKGQALLIHIIARFVKTRGFPIIVFFGSRVESQLTMEFNDRRLRDLLLRFPLDNNYLAENDVRTFLNDSFLNIRETHPLARLLGKDWPSREQVDEIVQKSSGQFIYASVAVNFISFPSSNPSTRLEIIRGLKPAGRLTPFAQIDELYRHIFSQVQDIESTLTTLAPSALCPGLFQVCATAALLNKEEDEVHVALADLTSIIEIKKENIEFLHASLSDFLVDPLRSGAYCISTPRWYTYLSIMWYLHGYKAPSKSAA